jgi:glutaredoxin
VERAYCGVYQEMDYEAVLYGSDESGESTAMVDLLNELGVDFIYRHVNSDPSAMREWEQLDGEQVPLLRVGKNSIVRGFDRIKVQQLVGWVGC